MEAVGEVGLPDSGGAAAATSVAFDFPAGDPSAPAKVPRRIRRRLLESSSSSTAPSTAEEIEAKLKDAALRRQQFHEWLSNKARTKPRSSSWSSQEEDLAQRLEAKLNAAEQKRLSLLAKAQMRLARLDELRQAAKNDVEKRFQKEREELGTRVESRVQQAEANRLHLLKAHMQRRAAARERTTKSLLQRVIRENKYKEFVNSAILQKRAAAEKKRMRLLEAEKTKAHVRVMQAHRVAKTICRQRETERRKIKEQLEDRLQRAKRQRAEYLKQRGSPHSSVHISEDKQEEILSIKLAWCWRRFVKSRKTSFTLAKAFGALHINENSVKAMPFERLALCIESTTTLHTVKALLDRLETRFLLSQSSSSSSLENIDNLLKRIASPKRKASSGKVARSKGMIIAASPKESRSSEETKLSRYPVRVVLCAYMILGHPNTVFSGQGEREFALRESAENFIREFELLIKIILDGVNSSHTLRQSSPVVLSDNVDLNSTQASHRKTFRSQLAAFDAAWRSYIYQFVAWKVKDARSLEDDLVRAACHLELSMMQKCKLTAQGQTDGLSHDLMAIQRQVTEDKKLLWEKILHLSGDAGIKRLECALSDTRSKYFEEKRSADPSVGPVVHSLSPSMPSSSAQEPIPEKNSAETDVRSGSVVRSLFGSGSYSLPNSGTEAQNSGVQSTHTTNQLPTDNELMVNEILHGGVGTLTINNDYNVEYANDIKAKVKETMEKAFWDGIMESLKQEEPDYGRIVKLAKEVRDELCEMAPQSWKQEILDSIDLDILSQVLESGSQDTDFLGRILEYALVTLQKLSAPANEDEMKKIHLELQSELGDIAQSDDKCKSSFVLATIKGLRFVLEQIQTLKKEISKARIQLMEPIIKGSAGLEYLQKAFADRYGPPSSSGNSLPLTVRLISSLGIRLEEEWNEHTISLSVSSTNNGLPLVTALRTGGSIPLASKQSPPLVNASGDDEQSECNGDKVDILVRLGLLELASGIEGLTVDTVPETFKLNAQRLRAVQSQLQQIIVFVTSMLVLRQILISDNVVVSPTELESIIAGSFKRLSELLDRVADPGIEDIVEAVASSSLEGKLQGRKEVMARLIMKSLQSNDAVFMRVSRSIYLAARGVVLGGSGTRGRRLADAALQRVGASMLLDLVVKAAETLIVMANVSVRVHGPWYRTLV